MPNYRHGWHPEDRLAQVQGLTAMTQLEGMESQLQVEAFARVLNERALLHVAGTRAVHSLYITWSGEPSPLLKVGNAAEIATLT